MADVTKAVLITGCSTGIGRATAEHLAQQGHTVYATARKLESIEDLEKNGCRLLALDVTEEESMKAAVEAVEEAEGAVSALVNNAGYSQSGAIETIPLDSIRKQFETNVFGLIRLSQLVLPGMRSRRFGRIVNVSSMGASSLPGRRDLPRHQVRGGGDLRRDAVRGPGLRSGRGGDRAGSDQDRVRDRRRGRFEGDGPYAKFNHAVGALTAGAYEGPMARLGAGPDAVAKVIEKAITRGRPRTRYVVTPSARLALTQRKLVTDRLWDRMMTTQFPRPR